MYNSYGPFGESVRLARILDRNTQQLQSIQLIPHPPCPFSFSYCEVLQRYLVGRSHPKLSFYLGFACAAHYFNDSHSPLLYDELIEKIWCHLHMWNRWPTRYLFRAMAGVIIARFFLAHCRYENDGQYLHQKRQLL